MTTLYYSIIERATGIMEFGRSNYIDHTDRPLHESLAYVPLNDLLVRALVSVNPEDHHDIQAIDFAQTHWDFSTSTWVVVWDIIPPEQAPVNPLTEKLRLRQALVDAATRKASMPDVSIKFKAVLDAFIAEVSSISITAENVKDVVLPVEIPK